MKRTTWEKEISREMQIGNAREISASGRVQMQPSAQARAPQCCPLTLYPNTPKYTL